MNHLSPLLLAVMLLPAVAAQADAPPRTAEVDESVQVAQAEPVTAAIDGGRSSVSFTSVAPAERMTGTASQLSGSLRFTPSAPTDVTGTLRFPVSSMRTGNQMRDRHINSEAWLNDGSSPDVVFEIAAIDVASQSTEGDRTNLTGTARGTLTLRGVSRPATASVEVALLTGDRKSVRVNFRMDADLREHGVPGRANSIGREVAEVIQVEGIVYAGW
jgi:polyisoprenoid-binding protein YceI